MIYKLLATLAWVLLLVGWTRRRDRRTHVPLMLAGIGVDLGIVVLLEVGRDVVGLAMRQSFTPLQVVHIGASTLAVLLYVPTLALGWRLWRRGAGPEVRRWHLRCAIPALAARTVGFACMWTI